MKGDFEETDFLPDELRSHLLSVHTILSNNVLDHIHECKCEGCLIRHYNAKLIRASNPFTSFKELRLVNTVEGMK